MKENKKTRNTNGMGITYYDERKKCFIAQVSVRSQDGKSKRLTATSKKSGKDALRRVMGQADVTIPCKMYRKKGDILL